ncbi:MAG: hypothetical protein U1E73_10030 [Planctomycetota bacterium]
MPDWQATLERAATLTSCARRHLPPLTSLLEAVVTRSATVRQVHDVLGTADDRRPGLLAALDAGLRAGHGDGASIAAARAVLFELTRALDAIASTPPFGAEPASRDGLAAALERMRTREHREPDVAPHATLACPRCRSRRVETRHTDAFGPREIEARCAECGFYDAWTEHGGASAWQSTTATAAPASTTAPSSSALTEAFAQYLRTDARHPRPLATALHTAGLRLEAAMLERAGWQPGSDGWPRIFVGRTPPADAEPGQLWLDSVEAMPMVLVEEPTFREPPRRPVWLAIRPVARWQFCAFAAVAPIVRRTVQIALPVAPLDPARLAGPELAPITSVLEAEAELYAAWFGKVLGTRDAWRGASHTLGGRAAALWTPGLREWIGELCSADESLRARIAAADVELSPDDDYRASLDDEQPRTLVGEAKHEPTTGLRTTIGMRLLTEISDTFRPFLPITVDRVYPR